MNDKRVLCKYEYEDPNSLGRGIIWVWVPEKYLLKQKTRE